jgi:hypothetical protein
MNLESVNGVLKLNVGNGQYVPFSEEWVKDLQKCSYKQSGDYIRKNIYPAWTADKRRHGNLPVINPKDLYAIIDKYTKGKSQ